MTNDADRQGHHDHFRAREGQAHEEGLVVSTELLAWFKTNYARGTTADDLPTLLGAVADAVEKLERRLNAAGI